MVAQQRLRPATLRGALLSRFRPLGSCGVAEARQLDRLVVNGCARRPVEGGNEGRRRGDVVWMVTWRWVVTWRMDSGVACAAEKQRVARVARVLMAAQLSAPCCFHPVLGATPPPPCVLLT